MTIERRGIQIQTGYHKNKLEPDEREAKLPAWAREKLAAARVLVAEYEQVANSLIEETKADESRVVLDLHADHPVGLGNPKVFFKIPCQPGRKTDRWISVHFAHGWQGLEWLEISGSDALIVRPWVSNHIKIKLDR